MGARRVEVFYPTEGFGESLEVDVEEGETLAEAIQARGDAQFEFEILHG